MEEKATITTTDFDYEAAKVTTMATMTDNESEPSGTALAVGVRQVQSFHWIKAFSQWLTITKRQKEYRDRLMIEAGRFPWRKQAVNFLVGLETSPPEDAPNDSIGGHEKDAMSPNHDVMKQGNFFWGESLKESWEKEMNDPDLQDHIWRYLVGDWNKIRRNQIMLSILRMMGIAILSWGLIEMFITSAAVCGVWTWRCINDASMIKFFAGWRTTREHRQVLLNSYEIVTMKLEPFFLPLKAFGTLMILPYYENMVCTIESLCFSKKYRKNNPMKYRSQALLISFLVGYLMARILLYVSLVMGTFLGFCKHSILLK